MPTNQSKDNDNSIKKTSSSYFRDCRMRFFVHMHGQGVGNLTVYRRSQDNILTPLLEIHGSEPSMDVNAWQRKKVVKGVQSNTKNLSF